MDLAAIGTVITLYGPIGSAGLMALSAHGKFHFTDGVAGDSGARWFVVCAALGATALGSVIGAPYARVYEKRGIDNARNWLVTLAVPAVPGYLIAAWEARQVTTWAPLVPFFVGMAAGLPMLALAATLLARRTPSA